MRAVFSGERYWLLRCVHEFSNHAETTTGCSEDCGQEPRAGFGAWPVYGRQREIQSIGGLPPTRDCAAVERDAAFLLARRGALAPVGDYGNRSFFVSSAEPRRDRRQSEILPRFFHRSPRPTGSRQWGWKEAVHHSNPASGKTYPEGLTRHRSPSR